MDGYDDVTKFLHDGSLTSNALPNLDFGQSGFKFETDAVNLISQDFQIIPRISKFNLNFETNLIRN